MKKIEKMASIAETLVGCPYIFGTSGKTCTPSLRKERANAKPAYADSIKKYCPVLSGKKSVCDGCKYSGLPAFDCRGLTYYACKNAGLSISSVGATTQWNTDSWMEKGEIDKMPTDSPCILFRQDQSNAKVMKHTGVSLGNGFAVDCRGHASGTVKTSTDSFPWTHYAIPYGAFDEADDETPEATAPSESIEVYSTIRKGSKGDDVKWAQNLLLALGYELPKYGADGRFGEETDAAVRAFQRDEGLAVDGVIGRNTWLALDKSISEPDEKQPESPATIKKGSKGDDVKYAQNLLLALGYELPKYGADGSFGEETDAAVRAFQRDEGLAVDGVIGRNTWLALDKSISEPDEKQPESPATFTVIVRGVDAATATYLLETYPGSTAEETNC